MLLVSFVLVLTVGLILCTSVRCSLSNHVVTFGSPFYNGWGRSISEAAR